MKRIFFSVALVIAFGATGANAENQIGTITNPRLIPDSIIVSANRKPTPVSQIGSSVTVINEDDIKKSQSLMVSDLLRAVPGVDVVQSGGLGRNTSIFLRGANSHHTLVIIDGVEMNDPSSPNGNFDFAHLNVSNIERIEILRGSQSVLYGSDAVGGVIQIFTKRGFGLPKAEFNVEGGSFNSFNESAIVSGSSGEIDYALFVARKDTDGISASNKHLGSVEKDGYENSEFSGRIGISLPRNIDLSISSRIVNAKADIDQSSGILDDPNFTNDSKARSVSVALSRVEPDKLWKPSIGLSIYDKKFNSIDEFDSDHPDISSIFNTDGRKIKLSTLHAFDFASNSSLTFGAETESEEFNSTYESVSAWGPYADTVREVDSRISSAYLLEEYSFNNKLYATVGLRYDYQDNFKEKVTYRLTSAYRFDELDLKLKANYGTGFKSPSLYQMFHQLYGNVDLEPEESKGWEIGFEKSFRQIGFDLSVTYFDNEYENLITLDENTFRSININKVISSGIEISATYSKEKYSVSFDYSYVDTKNKTNDAPIIRRPKNKFGLTSSFRPVSKVGLSIHLLYVGDREDFDFRPFPAELVSLENYTLTNFTMSYDLLSWMTIQGRVQNLFDVKYEEVFTYGTPERSVFVGFKLKS